MAIIALLALGALARPEPAGACSGPTPPAGPALQTARLVALVRVEAVSGPEFEPAYAFAVEEAFIGRVGPLLETPSLRSHQCGDKIVQPVGTRLVVAFDALPFAQGTRLNPYWSVTPEGALLAEGIDDSELGWRTLDELRAGMRDRFGEAGEIVPVDEVEPGSPSDPVGFPFWPIVATSLGAAVALFVVVVTVTRNRSSS